ncbi:hypothetical protein CASFOL_025340 [Castilleja foliolosa]|uniref:Uncharacterized protein n=1 Tax=Castilleja foliolosa TaxID=1961234 RepID=A0ABD3CSQ8_9LAMI
MQTSYSVTSSMWSLFNKLEGGPEMASRFGSSDVIPAQKSDPVGSVKMVLHD